MAVGPVIAAPPSCPRRPRSCVRGAVATPPGRARPPPGSSSKAPSAGHERRIVHVRSDCSFPRKRLCLLPREVHVMLFAGATKLPCRKWVASRTEVEGLHYSSACRSHSARFDERPGPDTLRTAIAAAGAYHRVRPADRDISQCCALRQSDAAGLVLGSAPASLRFVGPGATAAERGRNSTQRNPAQFGDKASGVPSDFTMRADTKAAWSISVTT